MSRPEFLRAVDTKVFEIQSSLLPACLNQNDLDLAKKWIQPRHYEEIIEERCVSNLCGFPSCPNELKNQISQLYRISYREKRIYEVDNTAQYCSTHCQLKSLAYSRSLDESAPATRPIALSIGVVSPGDDEMDKTSPPTVNSQHNTPLSPPVVPQTQDIPKAHKRIRKLSNRQLQSSSVVDLRVHERQPEDEGDVSPLGTHRIIPELKTTDAFAAITRPDLGLGLLPTDSSQGGNFRRPPPPRVLSDDIIGTDHADVVRKGCNDSDSYLNEGNAVDGSSKVIDNVTIHIKEEQTGRPEQMEKATWAATEKPIVDNTWEDSPRSEGPPRKNEGSSVSAAEISFITAKLACLETSTATSKVKPNEIMSTTDLRHMKVREETLSTGKSRAKTGGGGAVIVRGFEDSDDSMITSEPSPPPPSSKDKGKDKVSFRNDATSNLSERKSDDSGRTRILAARIVEREGVPGPAPDPNHSQRRHNPSSSFSSSSVLGMTTDANNSDTVGGNESAATSTISTNNINDMTGVDILEAKVTWSVFTNNKGGTATDDIEHDKQIFREVFGMDLPLASTEENDEFDDAAMDSKTSHLLPLFSRLWMVLSDLFDYDAIQTLHDHDSSTPIFNNKQGLMSLANEPERKKHNTDDHDDDYGDDGNNLLQPDYTFPHAGMQSTMEGLHILMERGVATAEELIQLETRIKTFPGHTDLFRKYIGRKKRFLVQADLLRARPALSSTQFTILGIFIVDAVYNVVTNEFLLESDSTLRSLIIPIQFDNIIAKISHNEDSCHLTNQEIAVLRSFFD
eukprot:gene85-107_t